jgi:hypothetical protein
MILRCDGQIDGQAVDLEANLNNGGFRLVGEQPTKPLVNDALFPPAL